MSRKQKRIQAIARRYPAWSLTDGKPSAWLHIGTAFADFDREMQRIRARWPMLSRLDRDWQRAIAIPAAIRHSRFCLSLYQNRLP